MINVMKALKQYPEFRLQMFHIYYVSKGCDNTGISDTMSLLDIQEAVVYLMRYSFGVYLSAEFVPNRKEIPAALLDPSFSFSLQ